MPKNTRAWEFRSSLQTEDQELKFVGTSELGAPVHFLQDITHGGAHFSWRLWFLWPCLSGMRRAWQRSGSCWQMTCSASFASLMSRQEAPLPMSRETRISGAPYLPGGWSRSPQESRGGSSAGALPMMGEATTGVSGLAGIGRSNPHAIYRGLFTWRSHTPLRHVRAFSLGSAENIPAEWRCAA